MGALWVNAVFNSDQDVPAPCLSARITAGNTYLLNIYEEAVRKINSPEMDAVRIFGSDLYQAVFDGEIGQRLADSLTMARQQKLPLRIRLHLSDAPALIDLPWEFLCDPVRQRLFLNPR